MIDTSPSLALVATIVVLVTVGVYLLLERSLSRVLLGVIVLGNGVNLLFLVAGGRAGGAPIIGQTPEDRMTDPLPEAMVLTAIVITMGVAAFILALVYRLFVLNRDDDDLEDDTEDRKLRHGDLRTAPDRDRSDDPLTGADTGAGDLFDDEGNPLTPEQYAEVHRMKIETDLMPSDNEVIDEIGLEETDESGGDR